jgi:acyl-CoA synthetase (AMP-forming)/AMP-acid ligase II
MTASVLDLLNRNAERSPDATAMSAGTPTGWESVTWAELRDAAAGVAGRASGLPAGPGPVVLVVDNSVAAVAVLLGLAVAGREVLLVEAANSYLADDRSAVLRAAPSCVVGPDELDPAGSARLAHVRFGDLTAGPAPAPAPARSPSLIHQLTSGSTGEQRIVRHSVDNVVRGGEIYRDVHGLTDADTVFATIPLAHSFGLVGGLAAALASGARLLTLNRFNLRVLSAGLHDGATVMLSTPLGYDLIASAERPGPQEHRLRLALSSGGPLSERVAAKAARRLGVRIHQVYGSTETGLIACTYDRAEPWPDGSVGRFGPGVDWRIVDDDAPAPDRAGRLLVRTATMFDGYLDSPPADRDRFYDTGDLVRTDEWDSLFVLARKSTFVNVGGRKVNPRRIERVISEHCEVAEIAVYGAGLEDDEQEIHAAVVLTGSTGVAELLAFCRSRLMPYEVPHHVHVVSELPRTTLGKVSTARLIHQRLREGA